MLTTKAYGSKTVNSGLMFPEGFQAVTVPSMAHRAMESAQKIEHGPKLLGNTKNELMLITFDVLSRYIDYDLLLPCRGYNFKVASKDWP